MDLGKFLHACNLSSLEKLVNFLTNTLSNSLNLFGTLRKFLTTRHFKVKFTDNLCSVPVGANLKWVFGTVFLTFEGGQGFESPCNLLIRRTNLLKLHDLASLEELVI